MDIAYKRYCLGYFAETGGEGTYSQEDLNNTRGMLDMTMQAYDYVDAMIRQYLIGYAATVLEDMDQFRSVSSTIEKTDNLHGLSSQLGAYFPEMTQVLELHKSVYQTMQTLKEFINQID